MTQKMRILSIDGGGIRGVIPASVLVGVERMIQEREGPDARLADHFDLFAGTSMGGMLAALLLLPDNLLSEPDDRPEGEPPRPTNSAADALDFLENHAATLVNNPPIERVKRLGGLIDAKYPSTGFHEVLDEALGPDNGQQPVPMLSQLLRPTVITSYSASAARPYFFKQHWAARDDGNDFALRDVALATSAAPTFFEAARVAGDGVDLGACVDGGIFANNPALCAYAEAHSYYGYSAKDMAILSLGTGSNPGTYAHEKMRKWGAVRWVMPLIDMLMSGSGAVADFQLAQIFDTLDDSATDHRYIRLQADLSNEHRSTAKMDNADPTNVRRLQRIGENVVRENRAEIERFLDTQILGRTDD